MKRNLVRGVSDDMLYSLDRKENPFYTIRDNPNYIKFLNERLEEVDPGAKEAFKLAREMLSAKKAKNPEE